MKIKLIATLLGLAIAGGANAAIATSASGNGELFFQLWDTNGTSDVSDDRNYVRDLGTLSNLGGVLGGNLNNWASSVTTPVLEGNKLVPTPLAIFTLGADANLTSFLAGTSNTAGLRWNVTAVDSSGMDRFLTTSSGITAAQLPTYTQFRNFASQGDKLLGAANPGLGASGESVVLTGSNTGLAFYGSNVAGQAKFTTDGAVGDKLGFFLLYEKAATGTGTSFMNQYKDASTGEALTWEFKGNGDLVYAPVPEPESYALFLAGLGMIGAIARRRRLGK